VTQRNSGTSHTTAVTLDQIQQDWLAYLERAVQALKHHRHPADENPLQYLSPLGWEYTNLTGNYVWPQKKKTENGKFRPLRPITLP
jgi:hypothetical protein